MIIEDNFVSSATDDIVISAGTVELDESDREIVKTAKYVYGYYLCIENNSSEKIQLIGKNWNITDSKGHIFCDNSQGFKGEIPTLEPGEYFEFTSVAPLNTPSAVFYGSCKVLKESANKSKDIKIPTFIIGSNKKNTFLNFN